MQNNQHPPRTLLHWLPLVILGIAILVLFYRLFLGEALFWGLPSLQFNPWRTFAITELSAGRWPLWNPFNGAGTPLIANYQSALFYPPNLLTLILPGPQVLGWIAMAHIFWAGLGMWLFLGAWELPILARGVGTLAFGLNSAVVARMGTSPMVAVAAWLPWLLLTTEYIIRRRTVLSVALLAVCCAMQLLAGHAQWTFYSLILVAAYLLYRVWMLRRELTRRQLFSTLALVATGLALGVGVAAIQLAPTAELQRQSQRADGVDETFALNFSYELPLLITQFNPNFFGNPGNGTYLIGGAQFETASYVGIVPLMLALLISYHYGRYRRRLQTAATPVLRLVPFFAATTLIAFLFAMGKNSIVYTLLFRYVPGFNLFQAPARWLLLAVLSLSVLAAIGVSIWKPERRARIRARLWVAGAIAVTVIAVFLKLAIPQQPILNGLFGLGILLTLTAVFFALVPDLTSPRRRTWSIALLVFLALDMAWANGLLNPTVPNSFYAPIPGATAQRTFRTEKQLTEEEFGQYLLFKDYQVAVDKRASFRVQGFPNMNLLDQQPSFNTFEPLRPAGFDRFNALLNAHPAPNLYAAAAIPSAADSNPPRVWLAPTLISSQDPIQAMSDPAWNPYLSVFVEGDVQPLSGIGAGKASISRETPQELEIVTESNSQAALVVADTWYPGWKASIDGVETPIYRANAAFRAVGLPAGAHTVRMWYDGRVLQLGAIVTGLSIIVLAALIIYGLARTRRPQSPAQ